MIVTQRGDETLLFRQTDHAQLAGEMAARLKDPPSPASAFVAAARLHDNGWREADDDPLLDPESGMPHTYMDLPRAPYREVWQRGIDRAIDVDPHVGLLVLLHGIRFFAKAEDAETRAFHDAQRARADDLLRELGLPGSCDKLPDEIERASDWVAFMDGLSLFVCERWDSPWDGEVGGRKVRVERLDDVRVTTRPWIFAAPFAAELPARVVPTARRFRSQDELREGVARAPGRRLRVEMVPS